MSKVPDKSRISLICFLLGLTTLITFGQVCRNDFINYDDTIYVTENQHVRGGLTFNNVFWAFTAAHGSNWHPITGLSHIIDCQLFGLNPAGHHFTNLLLHIANTLLLFLVLKDMTAALWQSAFVAALFALHPLHVESVAWIAERKDVLSTTFWFLTMAAYVRYVRQRSVTWYIGTLVLFALGLMTKPMLVTLPFVLLLLDYWPLGRLTRQAIFEKLPFFALSVILSVITFLVQQKSGAMADIDIMPLKMRFANAIVSYLRYVGKMIWPNKLAVFYPYQADRLLFLEVAAAVLMLLGISILVIMLASRHRYLLVGWFWYLGTLVPVIGLVQVGSQAMADRYTYIPLTGLFIIIAWGFNDILAGWRYRKIILGTAALMALLALSICTYFQLRHWRNSITLFSHAISVTSENILAQLNFGEALASKGKPEEAMNHYRQALRIKPDFALAHNNLGDLLLSKGKFSEAISHFRQALQAKPDFPEALNNLAWALATAKDANIGNLTEALKFTEKACKLTEYNKPDFLDTMAAVYAAMGRFDEAIVTAEKALPMAKLFGKDKLALEIQNRLSLYKAGKPYISP
jgi:tetratricopeptide (TPR) repeat protein